MSNDIDQLRKAYTFFKIKLQTLQMNLNPKKCEIISENENDIIEDDEENIKIYPKNETKYLGQTINYKGETTEIIKLSELKKICSIINNTTSMLSRRARIKIYKIYIKSKYQHLVPLIAATDNLQESWKNIRKNIFTDTLLGNTLPREAAVLMGISYYNIIVKPFLKLLKNITLRTNNNFQFNPQIEFMKKACKNIFKTWLVVEPNLTTKIKEMIDDFISKSILHTQDEFDSAINIEAAVRLFKNGNPPENVKKLAKLKLPRLIEIISNAPYHIIEQMVHSYRKGNPHETEIKYAKEKILTYLLLETILDIKEFQIPKPDEENINDIIEYQQIFDLKIEIMVENKIKTIKNKVEEVAQEIIQINSDSTNDKSGIKLPKNLENIINRVRNEIGNKNKKIWIILETAVEKALQFNNIKYKEKKEKNRVGRPKKYKNKSENNENKSSIFMENFLKKNCDNKMDLDSQ